jgi:uncharacterized protein (DUF427 family)
VAVVEPQSAHRITVSDADVSVRVVVAGTVVAETDRARVLLEGSLPPRYYLPRGDVRTDLLERTDHATTCPFKGVASYWSLELDGARHDNLLWSYEQPIEGMEDLAGLLCFYNERVELVVATPRL